MLLADHHLMISRALIIIEPVSDDKFFMFHLINYFRKKSGDFYRKTVSSDEKF